jgi:hypothetical protein
MQTNKTFGESDGLILRKFLAIAWFFLPLLVALLCLAPASSREPITVTTPNPELEIVEVDFRVSNYFEHVNESYCSIQVEFNLPVYNGFVTVAFFYAQGNQIDEMDVSLSSRSYQTSDRFLVNKYVSVKGNAASCEVTDFSEIRSSAYKEIVFQPDEDMYRDSILSDLALVIVWAIFRCLYVIPVVLPALFFKCKLYHVNQHTLIVYTGRANHYVKVNGYRVDERNSLWPFTTIVLHANTPDGDHVEISIAPLTRHISLRVNGGLQTPVR